VFWLPQGRQDNPLYQITGWEGWERQRGSIRIDTPPDVAQASGQGLSAEYRLGGPEGILLRQAIDPRLWFVYGHNNLFDATADWAKEHPTREHPGKAFCAQWNGEIEMPLGEPITFSLYCHPDDRARLWIDGQLAIDTHDGRHAPAAGETKPLASAAGDRHTIKVQLDARSDEPNLSLNWESLSMDRQRVPRRYLYPAPAELPIDNPQPQ